MCVTHLEQWLTHSKCSLSVSYHYFYPPKLWLRFYILLVPKEGRSCLYCLPLKFNVKVLQTPNCCHPWLSPHPLPQPTSPWAHTSPVKASSLPSVSFFPTWLLHERHQPFSQSSYSHHCHDRQHLHGSRNSGFSQTWRYFKVPIYLGEG